MYSFLQDLRHGARLLLRTPGFTVVAVLTLALGIGANTAVFTMVRSALFSMFGPVPEPSRVERIWASNLTTDSPRMQMSMPDFESVRQQSRSFSSIAAWTTSSWLLDFGHGPVRINGARVSPDFFSVLQAQPAMGRGFASGSSNRLTAVISDRLWRQTYESDAAILSRTIDIEGLSYTIVGVMPDKFFYQSRDVDVWIPLSEPASGWNRAERGYMVFGRLQAGVTEKQAETELATIAQRLAGEFPTSNHGWSFVPVSLWHEQMKRLGMTGIFLFAPVLFVLLIACANVGTMLLARASVRQGEIAVRAALGGSRSRLVRQLLTESLLLSFGGAVAGFAAAAAAIRLVIAFEPAARAAEASTFFHVDWVMFVFALGVALLTCVLFGLSPALTATKVSLNSALKEREGAGATRTKQLSRERLIGWQVGLAVIFVVIAAAFGRGINRIEKAAASAGFEPRNLITFDVTPSSTRFGKPEQLAAYYNDLLQRIEAVPGVQSAGASDYLPLLHRQGTTPVSLDPAPPSTDAKPFAVHASVTPGFFETARIPVRRGRAIGNQDTPKSLPVACVNETFARRYSSNQNVLGKHVRIGADGPWLTVVGVIADTLDDPILKTSSPYIFVAQSQAPMRTLAMTVRPAGDPASVVPAIRRAVWDFDRDQDLGEIVTAQQALDDVFRGAWTAVSIMGTFAVIGLLLAATGVYGIMSFITAQRTREVGVRLALGASPRQILAQVVSRGALRVALGLAIGLLIGGVFLFVFHRSGTSGDAALLHPDDPLPYVMAAASLAVAAMLGTYIPARRASKVDPMVALRYE